MYRELVNLHFNMLLLNRVVQILNNMIVAFTFQYASIKPVTRAYRQLGFGDLHFNMLLLNRTLLRPLG